MCQDFESSVGQKFSPLPNFFPDIFMQQTAKRTAKILKFRLTYLLSAPYFFKLHYYYYYYLQKWVLILCPQRILVKMKLKWGVHSRSVENITKLIFASTLQTKSTFLQQQTPLSNAKLPSVILPTISLKTLVKTNCVPYCGSGSRRSYCEPQLHFDDEEEWLRSNFLTIFELLQ